MNTFDSLQKTIYDIILTVIPYIEPEDLGEETDLFILGLDSVNAMRLILHLQNTFCVTFSSGDLNFENFKTIANISRLLEQKVFLELV